MNKTVLITGASSGIGKATAYHFANAGWNVIATMRSPEKEPALAQLENVLVTQLEVTDPVSIQTAIEEGIRRFGKIDVLVNNAGYGQQGLFETISAEKVQAQFDTNVFGLMNVTRTMLPHFRENQSGTVVNISSGVGRLTTPLLSIYCASKFAVEGFSEALAYELDSQNIKVKIVEPGAISTPFYDRASRERPHDSTNNDYKMFMEEMANFFEAIKSGSVFTPSDVAKVIYAAATDGSHQLRYIAGPDAEQLMTIRDSKPDQEYVDSLRKIFLPNGFKESNI